MSEWMDKWILTSPLSPYSFLSGPSQLIALSPFYFPGWLVQEEKYYLGSKCYSPCCRSPKLWEVHAASLGALWCADTWTCFLWWGKGFEFKQLRYWELASGSQKSQAWPLRNPNSNLQLNGSHFCPLQPIFMEYFLWMGHWAVAVKMRSSGGREEVVIRMTLWWGAWGLGRNALWKS